VRRHGFALGLLALVVAILFARPLLTQEVFTFRDHGDYFQPLRYYTAIQISYLRLPYWNPYSASGEPWLANPQTGVFYPPTWLFTFMPFPTAYMLYLALHLTILGWGGYLLFTRFASNEAAMAGATALMLSGPVLSLLDVQNNFATFAWVPLVIWCALSRRPLLGGAALALAFLGGEPFFAAFAAVMFAVVIRKGVEIALAAATAAGLSAVQLLPFLEMLRGSDRVGGLTPEQMARESMRPADWLRVAIPPRLDANAFDPQLSQHFIPLVYVGVVIAALALVAWVRVRDARVAGWSALLLTSILISVLAGMLMPYLPLTLFRYPARLVPFGALAMVALAVLGWDRIRPKRRWADLLLIAILVADLLPRAQPLLGTSTFRPHRIPYPPAVGRAAKIMRLNQRGGDRDAWIAGYTNLYQRRFDASTAAPVMNGRYARLHDAVFSERQLRILNFLGVGFVLAQAPVQPLEPFVRVRSVTAYANSTALPLATWWSQRIGDSDAVPSAVQGSVTSAEVVVVDSRHARVVVNAPADGVVMIGQQDSPSWRVYVDGREAKKLVAGGVFRAVAVSRGRREIIWRYRPRAMWIGAAMTLVTLVTLQVNTFVKRGERRAKKKFSS
jgi:hypothetical protein